MFLRIALGALVLLTAVQARVTLYFINNDITAPAHEKDDDDVDIFIRNPKGQFASINVASSLEAVVQLQNPTQAAAMAAKMDQALGSYNPWALLHLACYHMRQKNLARARLIYNLALLRANLDVLVTGDETVLPILKIMPLYFQILLNKQGQKAYVDFLTEAYIERHKAFELDAATPRAYDRNWPRLHSYFAFKKEAFPALDESKYTEFLEQMRDETSVKFEGEKRAKIRKTNLKSYYTLQAFLVEGSDPKDLPHGTFYNSGVFTLRGAIKQS